MEDDQMELQLLPTPNRRASRSHGPTWPSNTTSSHSNNIQYHSNIANPSLDLQLSNTFQPSRPSPDDDECALGMDLGCRSRVEASKWKQTDQIQRTSMENEYVERLKEMTHREMELAQSELSCARHMWERAQEEVDRVEKMKAKATCSIDPTCMEITCQACRRIFRP
ncbi:protein indeterminate-domain 16 [Tanacetum coccineum]